ncbi:MAG: YhgE/Pip domain-containing protein [Leuconostoc citreum]|jgi:putative membrane protein|uniref:YhgE/Pip domain-containing protein n=1 Tax=uncultured Leuconostoc sp. TaxID=173262 RepID=UPI0028050A04|nr:YhgE/Pip domain-containing protein [uncultured Leuconostoc sp.]MDU7280976.1 YhgE/Pip domain-containing protein [Leuconostoc citreum]
MKFWQSAEWQRISKLRGLKLLLVGIAVIPSIYAVIFLSSLWDTYGKIDNLPVAVVNNDQAADINGKTQHLGQDLTDKLLREKPLKLSEVSSQKAKDGLKSGKYYMTITIPSDFTNNAGTLLSNDPKYAKIDIAQNAGQSFIAEKMTSSAADKIKASVNRSLQQVYNETILSATKSSQKGFQAGADGATQLNNGLGQLADGSQKLNDGAQALTNGSSTLAGGLSQYTNGVSQANTGSNQLSNGAGAAATGANQLASGTSQLAQNAPKLAAGSQQLASGAQELARKLQEVSDGITTGQTNGAAQIKQLEVGLATLTQQVNNIQLPENAIDSNGLTQNSVNLKEGLEGATIDTKKIEGLMDAYNLKETNPKLAEQLVGIVRDLEGNIQKTSESAVALSKLQALIPQLDAFKKQLPQLKAGMSAAQAGNQQAITKLNGSLTQVSQLLSQQFVPAANQLASGAEQLNNGQQQVSSASAQLNNGANKLADGNAQLANGVNQLNGGLGQLVAKNGELNAGAGQLNQGAQQLTTGTQQAVSALGQAQNGTQTLAQKLADGAIKLDKVHNDKANVSALTQPVKSNQTNLSEVDNNGTGMTPYMMSVGLFVGMITFSAIYDFVTVAKRPKNGFAWWADKQTVNMPVWIAQAIIITTLLLLVDGLQPKNVGMLYLTALIVAFAFNQLVLLFSIMFGKLGSGLMIIALVLQLSASAGSYPIELSNNFFQTIHPWVPMTYSVHAFREVISIGGSVTNDLIILLIVGIVSMVLTWGVYQWKLKHNPLFWGGEELVTD